MMRMKKVFKPYQLVHVSMDNGRYSIIGQAMSFVTPEGTLMVRMVPEHPGTLQEIAVDRIRPFDGKQVKVHYATCRGMGQFPDDMLRYDSAVPVTFKVEQTDRGPKAVINRDADPKVLVIATVTNARRQEDFCDARWQSFLWSIERLSFVEVVNNVGTR